MKPEPAALTLPPNPLDKFILSDSEQRAVLDEFQKLLDSPGDLDKVDLNLEMLSEDKGVIQERAQTPGKGVCFATACREANVDYYAFTLTRRKLRIMPGDFGFRCDAKEAEYRDIAMGRLRVLATSRNNITALKHTSKEPDERLRIDHHIHAPQMPGAAPSVPGLPAPSARTMALISKSAGEIAEYSEVADEIEAQQQTIDAEFTQTRSPEDTHRDP